MSVVTGQISGGSLSGTPVEIELPTVRVPELSSAVLPQGTDLLVLYQNQGNTTTSIDLDALRDYVITGGNPAALTPVVFGADVEIEITAGMANQSRVNVPVLANKMFTLERVGQGWVPLNAWLILPSGGFDLLPKNAAGQVVPETDPGAIPQVVNEGEIFVAHVFDLVAATPPSNSNPSGLFSDIVLVDTNKQLSITERGKLLHAAFGETHGVITLEDIADAPANSLVVIETMINNDFDTKVQTKSAQSIYFGDTAQSYIWLGKSEFLWMLRGNDGWYVINSSDKILNVGNISYAYKQKPGTLVCRGQEVNRSDYPRLWQWVQSLGVSLVEDTTWFTTTTILDAATGTRTTYSPYEGCFSYGASGIGGDTFRLPNLLEKFMRGLRTTSGTDSERTFNNPGGIQHDINKKHAHDIRYAMNGTDGSTENGQMLDPSSAPVEDGNTKGINTYAIQASGGYESRPINVGLLPLINT